MPGAGEKGLIILRNSNYVNKHIIDAEEIMANFRTVLDSAGSASFQDLIEATGQTYNPLVTNQLINGIVQLIVASNYFKDIGTPNNIVLDAYTSGYGIPTQYVQNMTIKFRPAYSNTGNVLLSVKGLSPVRLLTDMGNELSSGSLVTTQDYSAIYDASKSAFILSSSFEDSGSQAIDAIRVLVESLGISFSTASSSQLAQAISTYALTTSYDTSYTDTDKAQSNYVLKPFGNLIAPTTYENGMVLRFRPAYENTLQNPTAQIVGLPKCRIYASNGDSVQVGDLNTEADVLLRYLDGSFYLVSNRVNSIQLGDGVSVNKITNDVSLSDGSITSLPTEYAVKEFVEARVNAQRKYSVVSGKETNGVPSFLQKYSDTSLNVLAGESGKPSYHNLVNLSNVIAAPNKPNDTSDPDDIITFTPSNMFDGDNSTYYETLAQGSDVIGVKDPISGEYTKEPAFIGAKGLTENVARVSILGNSYSTSPQTVKFQYCTTYSDAVEDNEWQDIGEIEEYLDVDGIMKKRVIPEEHLFPFSSGTPSVIELENFVPRTDATDINSVPVYPYAFRVVPTEFTGTNVGWEVVTFGLQVQDKPVDPLIISYADGSIDYVTEQSIVSLDSDLIAGDYWLIKYKNSAYDYVLQSSLYEGFDAPLNPVEGNLWTKITSTGIETYYYDAVSEDEDGNPTSFAWVPTNYVKLARVVVGGTAPNLNIVSFSPLAFGGKFTQKNVSFASSPMSFTHNIGDSSTTKISITCISNDGTYTPGDTVELSNYALMLDTTGLNVSTSVGNTSISIDPHTVGTDTLTHTVTPNPHNHTATSTVSGSTTASYVTAVSSVNTATLLYKNIALPNKSTGVVTPINTSRWKLSITCERTF